MTEAKRTEITDNQWILIIAILLSAFIGLSMGFFRSRGLDGSALLYIGIPTLIAVAFTKVPPSKSVLGSTLKAITFVILISGPLLQEGFICMIMAAPLFYIVGALAAFPFDLYRKKKRTKDTSNLNMFILPSLLLLMSMEGVIEETSFNRKNTVVHTQILNASLTTLKKNLGKNRTVSTPSSFFAKLFPRPNLINANGLKIGDRHWLELSYMKWVYWNETKGQVQFEITEHQPHYLKFKPISDTTYISNYLAWEEAEVIFLPITSNHTQVTWRIKYQRKLDPAWYMQPLQNYSVSVVSKLLTTSLL